MNVLLDKVKEVLYSVLPITAIVVILHFSLVPLEGLQFSRFLLGALFVIIGLSIFLFGVDIGLTPIGNLIGAHLTKTNKVAIVAVGGIVLGFIISIAEPDLHILARQIDAVTSGLISMSSIVIVVSIGIGLLLSLGMLRIVFNIPIHKTLTVLYMIVFILALFTSPEFLAMSFDACGATTGALTVPFILALASGVSALKKDSKASEEDSFGLVGITSIGAILSVMMMSIVSKADKITSSIDNTLIQSDSIIRPFLQQVPGVALEIFVALLPILIILLVFQKKSFKLSKRALGRILKGVLYTFIGLVIFLAGVNAGFMEVGTIVGYRLATFENKSIVVIIGFILGLVTILAEPAVHVLTNDIEEVTSGYIKRKVVFAALCIGVGFAVALSILRIAIPEIQLWHYLLPSYIIAIVLAFMVPKLFVGIAFDSGGVASGPMTATFILAFAQGVAGAIESADVMIDGFGVIAMVATTPLIALQILGLIFKLKTRKEGMVQNG